MALVVLSWQDNLEKRFMPPKRIWLDNDEIETWFKRVDQIREEEMTGKSSTTVDGPGTERRNKAAEMLIVE
jgi:hypothetical protein